MKVPETGIYGRFKMQNCNETRILWRRFNLRKLNKYDHISVLPKWIEETNQELEILRAMQKVIDDRLNVFSESVELIERFSKFMNN